MSVVYSAAVMTLLFVIAVECEVNGTTSMEGVARGGYGGYGGGGYGGGGYGGDSYGGHGHGGYGHGAISMDSVSILGLLSLGALLLRSILAVLQNNAASGRSLDVADINLPLIMSDLPEAVAGLAPHHVIRERSSDGPTEFVNSYNALLRTEVDCIPHFLCTYWASENREDSGLLDLYMAATAGWLSGSVAETAAIYDRTMAGSQDHQAECHQAKKRCAHKIRF